jgi:histidinol dehydrogenase
MPINLKTLNLGQLSSNDRIKLIKRSQESQALPAVKEQVQQILQTVKLQGDQALRNYTKQFDQVELGSFRVSEAEFDQAGSNLESEFLVALKSAKQAVSQFAQSQLPQKTKPKVQTFPGVSVWQEWRAYQRVGLYVPGGLAAYPSTVLMTAVPALAAGCQEIVMVSPPDEKGKISKYVLATAKELGIREVYKLGGAQAVAALAFGTESIAKVDKIFGPGNKYVNLAKQLVSDVTAIDKPAGPSEVLIIADKLADPRWLAADLICDAEHSGDNPCLLLTNSPKLAQKVATEVNRQAEKLTTYSLIKSSLENFGFIGLVNSLQEAVDFANEFAPEHLLLRTSKDQAILPKIINSPSVFLGQFSAKAAGDYATGANHVLPTGGQAKVYSALNVEEFGKWIEVQQCSQQGLAGITPTIKTFAKIENLPAHGEGLERGM